jgi:hypothetical protein
MNINHGVPVQISYRLANRFYGPIILLSALDAACIHNHLARFLDLSLDAGRSPE